LLLPLPTAGGDERRLALAQEWYRRAAVSGGTQEETVLSVAELDRRLRRAVETASGDFWTEGEVSSLKRAPSGHLYFTLKDESEDAVIDCVLYRFDALRAQRFLSDGARIQIWGRVTVWAPRGRLQLIGQRVRPAGRGALLVALEELKKKLQAEGLFDPSKKRALPEAPRVVGVVTSKTGAAFADIQTVAFRRGHVRLVLSPALVQGDGAVRSLLSAINRIERYPGLDVLIIGRGGGSGEDLMAFNDERVVRRLAAVRVPVVSAVGHETDISLSDLVADRRAATPSQAAELCVPDERVQHERLRRCQQSLLRTFRNQLALEQSRVQRLRTRLADPRFVLALRDRELSELERRLRGKLERKLTEQRAQLASLHSRLNARHPRTVIALGRAHLGPMPRRLSAALRGALQTHRAELGQRAARLDALSPLSVLGRGYAIVLDANGRALLDANRARTGDQLEIRLSRGRLLAEVRAALEPEEPRS
jgi:exodeoxyribonuclease VII large subunit